MEGNMNEYIKEIYRWIKIITFMSLGTTQKGTFNGTRRGFITFIIQRVGIINTTKTKIVRGIPQNRFLWMKWKWSNPIQRSGTVD